MVSLHHAESPRSILTMDRREFVRTACVFAAAAIGLPASVADAFAQAVTKRKPTVIWLSFQECTGCTESLLRTTHPDLATLVLDLISLEYHEALSAAAGKQAEAAKRAAMAANKGSYILVLEGAIPTKDGGIYCKIGGVPAVEVAEEAAADAAAILAIGSCASWGGLSSTSPNPTGARGVPAVLTDKTVVTIPGCPPNPYNFLGTVLQYATFGTLPQLDALNRPKFAYERTIHEDCPRRPHFDAGRFAAQFGDEGHRAGYCLYKLGCKGPQTHGNCSLTGFTEVGTWPVSIGHPCYGCTEQGVAFNAPVYALAGIAAPTPSNWVPPVNPEQGPGINPLTTGIIGLVGGAAAGAAVMASRQLGTYDPALEEQTSPEREPVAAGHPEV